MNLLIRSLQRLAILGLGVFSVWLLVFVVFRIADRRLPWILALSATYGVAAYVVLPRVLRMGLKILGRKSVPRFTTTTDGLPGDPVNLVLHGTDAELHAAFSAAGWSGADPLGFRSSWGMIRSFLFNAPYPTAPFSTLFLFGRGQDIGFQKPIGASPRKRHHIRFWALSVSDARATIGTASFWFNTDRPPAGESVFWVGAGTKDTGFGFTRMTFKITHSTCSDTNAERDFILEELQQTGCLQNMRIYHAGDQFETENVNHYTTDGEVAVADLKKVEALKVETLKPQPPTQSDVS